VKNPYAVAFAGVPGTSKSITAQALSCEFQLPILSSDMVRFEVKEDLRIQHLSIKEDLQFATVNQNGALAEYDRRIKERRLGILARGLPIILDASIDRTWVEVRGQLQDHDYDWFMINMELTRPFLEDLYRGTGREPYIAQLDDYCADHQRFVDNHSADISIEITDAAFLDRRKFAMDGLRLFLEERQPVLQEAIAV
jgi:predicted kinase